MHAFEYPAEIRADIATAHNRIWEMLRHPGNWWRGEDRLSIAAETRNARSCEFCRQRKQSLSPNATIDGSHHTTSNLPGIAIEAVHRITTDASRLSESWLSDANSEGLSNEAYVELLGICVAVISIDTFHIAMGLPLQPLPLSADGEPDGYRPPGAQANGAWVDTVNPQDLSERDADLYGGAPQMGNVITAMSLVPDAVRMLMIESNAQYLPPHLVANPESNGGRAITRPQIELIAGRVSALNDCFY